MTEAELFEILDRDHHVIVRGWLDRGDGVAIYINRALDSERCGHRQFMSFGSARCQLETTEPPERLPDIGASINWAYRLEATVKR